MHALLAQQGVRLPFADFICHFQRDFAQRFAGAGLVVQSPHAFLCPALQGRVHGGTADLQIGADRRDGPPLTVQSDDCQATLRRVRYLHIGRIPARGERGTWPGGEYQFDTVMTGPAPKADVADLGDFSQEHGGQFGVQVHDQLAHGRRQAPRGLRWFAWRSLSGKQTHHSHLLEVLRFAGDGALCHIGLFRPLARGLPVQDDRAQDFIDFLLRSKDVLFDLLPAVGAQQCLRPTPLSRDVWQLCPFQQLARTQTPNLRASNLQR